MNVLAEPATARNAVEGGKGERDFRPDIQGLRALAVAMVVIYHLYPPLLPGGFVGVDVFFVISGFLITGHLWRGYQRTGKVGLVDFWGRRAKRLVPAAALVLTVTWVASRLVLPATRLADTADQVRASALYFQNWLLAHNAVDYLKSNDAASPLQHFWSLSVEEQFYLLWPWLFVAAVVVMRLRARRAGRHRGPGVNVGLAVVAGLAGALVLGSLAYSVYDTRTDPKAAYFVTTTRVWELGLGGLLALLPERLGRPLGRQGWLGWAGLAAVAASPFLLHGTSAFPGAIALLPVVGTVALIAGGSAAARGGPARLTSIRPMVFLGGISYSLYLWHWPLIVLWSTHRGHKIGPYAGLALVAVAVLLSWLTKVWVEDKVRLARPLAGHSWRSVSTALAAVVPVTLVAVFIASRPPPWNGKLGPSYPGAAVLASKNITAPAAPIRPPPDDIAQPLYRQKGCLVDKHVAKAKACVFGDTKQPVLTVVLVGDSAAGEWFSALEPIAVQRHWKLITEIHSSCPWTATMMTDPDSPRPYDSCHTWGTSVLHDLLTTIRPDVVITSDYPTLATTVAHPKGGPQSAADIGTGMAAYWAKLKHAGMSVVAIRETPDLVEDVPECVDRYPSALDKCDVPVAKAIKKYSPIETAVQLTGIPVVDMNGLICGPTMCAPVVGNVLVYSDRHHLTSYYSLTAAPYLEERLFKADKILAPTPA
jgi:peptidoglycan/LPS O-acetylase OafA/YrhL